jgi:solute carrier family 25 oxoglutarate transporter 11
LHLFFRLARGGPSAFYEGITAAYLRQWTYGSCRLGMYSFALDYVTKAKAKGESVSFLEKIGMGCVSGGIGSFIGNPAELALVRMGGDGRLPLEERRNYKNVLECIYRTAKDEGLPALWRGAAPTVIRACLLSSSTLAVYSEAKARLPEQFPVLKRTELGTMFAGTLVSSLVANVIVNPFDVVKSRIQSMAIVPGQPPMYSGMADCFAQGLKKEGPWVSDSTYKNLS